MPASLGPAEFDPGYCDMLIPLPIVRHLIACRSAGIAAFARNESGAIALVFSLTLLPIVLFMALSVDYGANNAMRQRVQDALDSAVLAGAASSSPSTTAAQRIATAQQTFASAIGADLPFVSGVTFSVDPATSKVSGAASTERKSLISQRLAPALRQSFAASALPTANLVRALDVVMCVDATGSMQNTLSAVQNNITNFKTNLDTAVSAAGYRPFDRTRVRVIYYRDYGGNGWLNLPGYSWYARYFDLRTPIAGSDLGDDPAMVLSNFYDMASYSDVTAFRSFVGNQYASGGGDLPESGLECLWSAMNSSWTKIGDKLSNGAKVTDVFPVISIYTDAGAHPPNFASSVQNPKYPTAMPRDYDNLLKQWNDASVIDQKHKSILFYGDPAVDDDYYFGLESGWQTVKRWPGFSNPASLTSANNALITSLARGILGVGDLRLTD